MQPILRSSVYRGCRLGVCPAPVAIWGLAARPRFLRGRCLRSGAAAPALTQASAVHQPLLEASVDLRLQIALAHPPTAALMASGVLTGLHPHLQIGRASSTKCDMLSKLRSASICHCKHNEVRQQQSNPIMHCNSDSDVSMFTSHLL